MKHTHSEQRGVGPDPTAALTQTTPCLHLLLPPRDAAQAMSISERTLVTLTKRGDIPAVRIGRAVRYDPADLRAFVTRSKEEGGGRAK